MVAEVYKETLTDFGAKTFAAQDGDDSSTHDTKVVQNDNGVIK